MFSFLALIYGFLAMFILATLERNRREAVIDGPVIYYAGHGLMAASATGAALALGFMAWTNFVN